MWLFAFHNHAPGCLIEPQEMGGLIFGIFLDLCRLRMLQVNFCGLQQCNNGITDIPRGPATVTST